METAEILVKPAIVRPPGLAFIVAASTAGTLIEWYDFYIYGSLAAFFSSSFFPPGNAQLNLLISLATFATGFMARPFGALLFGRVGDMIGRKFTFLITLVGMGGATTVIGFLPSYARIGIAAPIMLVSLRLLQGLALGGEYGGAATYVAEHAPETKRGAYTSWIQMSSTIGFFLSLLVILAVRLSMGDVAFRTWGWRIPFLLSAVLVGLSVLIRMRLQELPLFQKLKAQHRTSKAPLKEAFGSAANWKTILIALFGAVAPQAVIAIAAEYYALYYLLAVLKIDYVTAYVVVALAMIAITPLFYVFASLSDRVGRRPVILVASVISIFSFVPLYALMQRYESNPPMLVLLVIAQAVPFAMGYAPVAALLVELFPARIRYTAISLPYHIGGGIFGGLVPVIGLSLVEYTGNTLAGLAYPIAFAAIGAVVSFFLLKETNQVRIWDDVAPAGAPAGATKDALATGVASPVRGG